MTKEYWTKERHHFHARWAPMSPVYRLLSRVKFEYAGKTLLELGYGHGADLYEMELRGADVYGLEIDPRNETRYRKEYPDSKAILTIADISKSEAVDAFPAVVFDLMYCLGVINYLSDEEIKVFLENIFKRLPAEGLFLLQYISRDYQLVDDIEQDLVWDRNNNPIRFIDNEVVKRAATEVGFSKLGSKKVVESYDLEEKNYRCEQYFLFQKSK